MGVEITVQQRDDESKLYSLENFHEIPRLAIELMDSAEAFLYPTCQFLFY